MNQQPSEIVQRLRWVAAGWDFPGDGVREQIGNARNLFRDAGDRIDLLETALKALLAWDSEFQFCNVDETGDTPCICASHPWASAHDHETTCEKYRTLVAKCRELLTDGTRA